MFPTLESITQNSWSAYIFIVSDANQVTDKQVYIGTLQLVLNGCMILWWARSADYFENTGGMSVNAISEEIRKQMQHLFDRDWDSEYASPLKDCFHPDAVELWRILRKLLMRQFNFDQKAQLLYFLKFCIKYRKSQVQTLKNHFLVWEKPMQINGLDLY